MKFDLKYKKTWLSFVEIIPNEGYLFNELIENPNKENYVGAWANILTKADTIEQSLILISKGLAEKNFKIKFIEKIENIYGLIEYDECSDSIISDADFLLKNNYKFKINDKLFPYTNENV